jgi:hypothetical protein
MTQTPYTTPTGRTSLRFVAEGVRGIFSQGEIGMGGMTRGECTATAERYVRSHGWTPGQYEAAIRRRNR